MKYLATLLLTAAAAHAALLEEFPLNEGATNLSATTVYSTVSADTGTFGGGVLPVWVTTNLPPIPGGAAAALYFDATGAAPMPTIATSFPGMTGTVARTTCAWIKSQPTQPASGGGIIVSYGGGSGGGVTAGRYTFRVTDTSGGAFAGHLRLEIQGSGVYGTRDLRDGKWHHVALVHTNGSTLNNITFYIDGSVDPLSSSSSTVINTAISTVGPNGVDWVHIGNGGWSTGRGFNGALADVRLYDTALRQSDILQLVYGSGTPAGAQPLAPQTILLGDPNASATFNALASGTPPLSFQWKFYGTNLPLQTNVSLVINPATPANVGPYSVTISNVFGTTNVSANLSLATPPIDPPMQAILTRGTGALTVSMPPASTGYTYQWSRNGTNLPGANASSYVISSASAADSSSSYAVTVTLGANSATSAPAAVVVVPTPASYYAGIVLGDGPAAYWRLDEANGAAAAVDQTTFHNGGYEAYTGVELGAPGALFSDADTASTFASSPGNYVEVPASPELGRTNAYTLEAWVYPMTTGARQSLISCYGGLPNAGFELAIDAAGAWVFRTSHNTSPAAAAWDDLGGGSVAVGEWTYVTATYDGTTKTLYTNGVVAGTQTLPAFPALGINLRMGAGGTAPAAATTIFNGTLDEPAIYRKALTASQVRDHYEAGALGSGVPPSVVTQPASQQVVLGDTNAAASFSMVVNGSPRMAYQWQFGGVNLPGQNGSTLTVAPVTAASIGTYSVGVTNAGGGIESASATLSYTTGPILPGAQAVFAGASATFSLTGMPAYQSYTYQWQHAGTNLPGAHAATLTLPAVDAGSAGLYTVVATLGGASATGIPVTLSVISLPSQTYSNTIAGDLPAVWWRLDDAPGATLAAETMYGVDAGSIYPSVTMGSEGALLGELDTCASFTGYNQGVAAGNSRIDVPYDTPLNPSVFSVECWALVTGGAGNYRSAVTSRDTGTGYVIYAGNNDAWQFWLGNGSTWVALNGPAVVPNQWAHLVGTFDGTTGRFYMNGALVASAPVAFVPNTTQRLSIGGGATETVAGNYFFAGRLDEVAVYTNALSLAQVQAHFAGAFQSGAAPRFTTQPLSRALLSGSAYTLSAGVHSAPPLSLQWQKNGVSIAGATNATLGLNPVSAAAAGAYQLVATRGGASSTSASATVQVIAGEAVSVNLEGFENAQTIAANGGYAGYVVATNWNELGYGLNSGSVTNLINHKGQTNTIGVAWTSSNNRHWAGIIPQAFAGDDALLGGFNEAVSGTPIVVTITGIPANYQTAGYSLYAYFGEPGAAVGNVTAYSDYGYVSVGGSTNYYHALDLGYWDGNFVSAVTTDPAAPLPADANYAVFTGLNSAAVTLSVGAHPTLTGPASLSGFQIVAYVAPPAAVPLGVSLQGGHVVLSWTGNWVLQQRASVSGGVWSDVAGGATPYTVPQPLAGMMFFRLRSP